MTDAAGDEITEKTTEHIDEAIRHHADVRPVNFMQWQLEVCPETDRLHFHVYVEYVTSVRLRTVRAEWTEIGYGQQGVREGTREQARHYITPEFYDKHRKMAKLEYTHLAGPWTVGEWREDDDAVAGISREQLPTKS